MCFCSETVPLRPGPEPFSRCAGQLAACPARTDSCPQRKKPRPRGLSIQYQFGKNNHFRELSSLIQTILSVSESHRIGRRCGSRTVPPVGNFTLPRRTFFNFRTNYKSSFYENQVFFAKPHRWQKLHRWRKTAPPPFTTAAPRLPPALPSAPAKRFPYIPGWNG